MVTNHIRQALDEARGYLQTGKADLALFSLNWVQGFAIENGFTEINGLDDLLMKAHSALAERYNAKRTKAEQGSRDAQLYSRLAVFHEAYLQSMREKLSSSGIHQAAYH